MLKVSRTITGIPGITISEAKEWLRVEFTEDDGLIYNLLTDVYAIVEKYTNRSLVEGSVTLYASAREELELPYQPINSITSITDFDGNPVDYTETPFGITFEYPYPDVKVEYTTSAFMEPGLKTGILEVLAWLYDNRGDDTEFQSMLSQNTNLQPYRERLWYT